MKAGHLRDPKVLDLVDVPDPTPGPGDLILKVRAAPVCGTDIRIVRGRKTAGVHYPSVINLIRCSELTLTGAFGLSRTNFERALDLLAMKRIDVAPLVTHRFGLPAIAEGLRTAEEGAAIKVAIVNR